jgi:hypothetical protein
MHDLDLLRDDKLPPTGDLGPSGIFRQSVAYGRALLQVFIGIDVDDLIEWTDLGVPEGPEFSRKGSRLAKRSSNSATVPGRRV